ncbi:MAG: DegV family protein [Oscillospiraceae bacterium]|nr:DegV family protein [Oscillospiraceae bacterium]
MPFIVFADGSANLPQSMLEGITLLPCDYFMDEKPQTYTGNIDDFDAHAYYESLKRGQVVKTSLLNVQLFISHFTPVLEQGLDVVYISMSSNISGTYNAAVIAAKELMQKYTDRFVHIVDSCGCGFGSGLLAVRAAELSKQGLELEEAAAILDAEVPHICQYFTVDDLNYLKRTGRVSGVTARVATVLNIKPILYGNKEGKIVSCATVRAARKLLKCWLKSIMKKEQMLKAKQSAFLTVIV